MACQAGRAALCDLQQAGLPLARCPTLPATSEARGGEAAPPRRRYYTQRRLARAAAKLGIPELAVAHQLEDRRVGLRMVVFTGPARDLGGGVQAIPSAWLCHARPPI